MGETVRCGIILVCMYTAQGKTKSVLCVNTVQFAILLYLKGDTQGCVLCVIL